MPLPTKEQVVELLKTGTPDERVAFVKRLPSVEFTTAEMKLIRSENPGQVVEALVPAVLSYSEGQHADWGAILAAALYERARKLWDIDPAYDVRPSTMVAIAYAHVQALETLGRISEVLRFTEKYLSAHGGLEDDHNVRNLKALHDKVSAGLPRSSPAPRGFEMSERTDATPIIVPPNGGAKPRRRSPAPAPPEDDSLGLGDAMSGGSPAAAPPLAPLPESRWLNAEIRDHDKDKPLQVGKNYSLEFGVDTQAAGHARAAVPSAALLFKPGEEHIELTIQLHSSDFRIDTPPQTLNLPRSGASANRPRFEIAPLRAGRGTVAAVVSKDGNFLLRMDIAYSIGAVAAEPPTTEAFGRPLEDASNLDPRRLSLVFKPAPGGGYECIGIGGHASLVTLPISEAELGDAIKTARDELMKVVTQRDAAARLVFQTGIDVDDESAAKALQTLARAGARLFDKLFFGPAAKSDVNEVGELIRQEAMKPGLTLQVISQRFPVPWGLLYLGNVDRNATLSWDNFLGMRCIVEVLPLAKNVAVGRVIPSDQPALSVSVNMHDGIDAQMKTDVVARQLEFWRGSTAKLGSSVRFAQRQSRADFLDALAGDAGDQLMYLYCHAVTAGPGGAGGLSASSLILSGDDRVTLDDLYIEAPIKKPLPGKPLVFINACESAELTPAFYDGFVPYFVARAARGVIGTECKMPAVFATEWALRFFPRFLGGEALGDVFLGLRREFVTRHNNPLGLLYAVYCNADTRIQPGLKLQ